MALYDYARNASYQFLLFRIITKPRFTILQYDPILVITNHGRLTYNSPTGSYRGHGPKAVAVCISLIDDTKIT